MDTDGHGSHVSGIAAGREYDYNGIEGHFGIAGVAPMAHLSAYKACWDIPRYSQVLCYPRDSIAALEAAVADGVDVVNFSVGGSTDTYRDAVDLAFQNAAAAGIFVATSVGNRATASDALSHPVPWMTTVAATRYRTDGGPSATVAPSSSRGPANVPTRQQTILKPDIGAPGVDVFSALSRGANGEPDWYYKSGTSMASPHIAGLAALQLKLHPRWSPMAVKSSMMTTANRYANEKSNAPFAGGAAAILPARMLAPGLVLESRQRDWTKFLQTPSRGYTLNAPSLQIPQLPGDAPLQVVRTLTNVSEGPLTYTADFTGPSTLGATVTPRRFTVGPGASIDVTISVRNRGLGVADWQHGWLRWSAADQNDVTIPVVARGAVTQAEVTAQRWAGANRYETAAAVSTKFTEEVDTVYLSSGTHFADALSASPIAAKGMVPDLDRPPGNPAPILLANNGLPRATVAALDRLQPSRIVILGGKKAIPASVEQDLMTQGYAVTRVGGANRYETSARLASAYRPGVPVVYVASGDDAAFPDALSGASLAALKGGPILLTRSDSVPSAVAEALRDLEPERVVVLGGTSRVSAAVYAELGADERIAGKNRYDTSAKIARRFATPAESVFVANGRTWPDALAGSVVAGSQGSPVVITEGNALSGPTREALTNLAAANIVVLGGTVAVSPAVEAAARAASR